jgi:peptide/nickel transport system substrate-binding protein
MLLTAVLAACGDPTATPAPVSTTAASTTQAATTAAAPAATTAKATTQAATTTAAGATTTQAAATTAAAAATTAAANAPKPGTTLVVGVIAIPQNMDPIVGGEIGFAPQNYAIFAYLDGLTYMSDAKVMPALAESWKATDATTWEFKLRQGVKFHNGEPFDSASVKYTFDQCLPPVRKSPCLRLEAIDSYSAPDPQTFIIKTKAADATFPAKLAQVMILPAKYYAEKGPDGFKAAPVGTGPFQFESYERDKQVTLKAFPSSWRGAPKVEKVIFKQIPDVATQVQALQAGEIDLMRLTSKDQYDEVKAKGFKVYNTLIGSTTVVDLETIKGGPLADIRVRQALNLAVNKAEMAQALFGDLTKPAYQVIGPVGLGYDPNLKPDTSYDPEKAKDLLKQAGIGDGQLSLTIPYLSGRVGGKETLDALTQYLGQIGVKVTPQPLDSGNYFAQFNKNQLGPAAIISRVYSPSDDGTLAIEWFTKFFATQRYNNDQLNTLYAQSLAEFDLAKREDLVRKMNKLVLDDYASIPLYYSFDIFASSNKVDGFKPSSNGYLIVENVTKSS